jgi:hypothetical protein
MKTLASIQQQILDVDKMIARLTEVSRHTPKPSVFAQIRSLEKEQKKLRSDFDKAAQHADHDETDTLSPIRRG